MTAVFTPLIDSLLLEHRVLSLAVQAPKLWAAPVFYALDPGHQRLLFATDPQTRHGKLLEKYGGAACATISGQEHNILELRGIQTEGRARLLIGEERMAAADIYEKTIAVPAHLSPTYWEFIPIYIKATDNRKRFGFKEVWGEPSST